MERKKSSPLIWVALAATVVAAAVMNRPQDPPKKSTRLATNSSSKKKNDTYTEADRKATPDSFLPISYKNKDVFVPIVKRALAGGSGPALGSNAIPGVAGWIFTGSAEVDGVPQALLENHATGEGVFLKSGELWNGLTVLAISSDSLSLRAEDGTVERVLIQADVKGQTPGVTIPPVTVSPLSGQIGNQPLTVQPTDNNNNSGGTGRNRRRNAN